MNFDGAERMLAESTQRVSETYDRKRGCLESQPDAYLQGIVDEYEAGNPIGRFLNGFTLKRNEVKYSVARELLDKRQLEAMGDQELREIAEAKLGLLASFRSIDRRNWASDLLEER